MKKLLLFVLLCSLFMAGCGSVAKEEDGAFLPVENEEKYEEIIAAFGEGYSYATTDMATEEAQVDDAKSSETNSYSETNVQVESVDEGDIVKTDGDYIYRAVNNRIYVVKANDGAMEQVDVLTLSENDYVQELYVDENRLTAVCGGNFAMPYTEKEGVAESDSIYHTGTRLLVYDIRDKANIVLEREILQEGNFLTARKVGDIFYLITSQYPSYYVWETGDLPVYSDSINGETKTLSYDQIYYPAGVEEIPSNQLLVGSVDLAAAEEIAIKSYLGAGETVYMNESSLYIVANTGYGSIGILEDTATSSDDVSSSAAVATSTNESLLYAFDIDGVSVSARSNRTIPGSILNQFSMDEYEGYFRIAMTVTDENGETDNCLYILDQDLNDVGSLTGLAPGESIYSARFMGENAYLVTFEQTDPLFALDLSDPAAPKALGELKIPGYSGYLHPYDENLLIGIGKEVILATTDWSVEPVPLVQGLKIALFDISDMENPVEVYSTEIGDRGTDSDALWNHKAFLFDKEKNLLVLPISVYTFKEPAQSEEAYGEFTQQGSYIFHIDATEIKLEKVITHTTGEDEYADWESYIDRNLYIDNVLYALSPEKFTSLDLTTMEEIATLVLK